VKSVVKFFFFTIYRHSHSCSFVVEKPSFLRFLRFFAAKKSILSPLFSAPAFLIPTSPFPFCFPLLPSFALVAEHVGEKD